MLLRPSLPKGRTVRRFPSCASCASCAGRADGNVPLFLTLGPTCRSRSAVPSWHGSRAPARR